jgi:hypothetical protein
VVNYLIDEELDYWKRYGSGLYPSIVINNRTYRGQLDKLSVFNALCAGFLNPPKICDETLGIFTPDTIADLKDSLPAGGNITGGFIVVIMIAVILVNIMIVYCYRRKTKREMQITMQTHIESAANQYFALSQSSSRK